VKVNLPKLCNTIREAWSQRQDLVNAHGSLARQLKSICRRHCGGDKVKGTALFKKMRTGGKVDLAPTLATMVLLQSYIAIGVQRKSQEKVLCENVAMLPVAKWATSIRGVADIALASLIGEAGNLNDYAGPAKLWKRFGVGLVQDNKGEWVRQRKVIDKKLAVAMGYSPKRRSVLWNVGACIIRSRKGATGVAADLLAYYESEKKRAMEKGCKKGHAHRRAQKHMEKRLLVLLWREWTGAKPVTNYSRLAA